MRRLIELALVVIVAACSHSKPDPMPASNSSSPATVRHWRVYDGDVEILTVADEPGTLTSTAPLPPGAEPVTHPFLTASALDAGHEDQLRELLVASKSTDEFIAALQQAGFRVVPD